MARWGLWILAAAAALPWPCCTADWEQPKGIAKGKSKGGDFGPAAYTGAAVKGIPKGGAAVKGIAKGKSKGVAAINNDDYATAVYLEDYFPPTDDHLETLVPESWGYYDDQTDPQSQDSGGGFWSKDDDSVSKDTANYGAVYYPQDYYPANEYYEATDQESGPKTKGVAAQSKSKGNRGGSITGYGILPIDPHYKEHPFVESHPYSSSSSGKLKGKKAYSKSKKSGSKGKTDNEYYYGYSKSSSSKSKRSRSAPKRPGLLRTRFPTFSPLDAADNSTDSSSLSPAPASEGSMRQDTLYDGQEMIPDAGMISEEQTPAPEDDAVVADPPATDRNIEYIQFNVQLDDATTDAFVVEVHKDWAPLGAARFLELVDASFFDGTRFFRVIDDFIVQWGISGSPEVTQMWSTNFIQDEPVIESNVEGTLTFAMAGPNTRTTQVFINYVDNIFLDDSGFSTFGKMYTPQDLDVAKKLYAGYGEGAPDGNGPDQFQIEAEGNAYLEADFPLLSYVISTERLPGPPAPRRYHPRGFMTSISSNKSFFVAGSTITMVLLSGLLLTALNYKRNKNSSFLQNHLDTQSLFLSRESSS